MLAKRMLLYSFEEEIDTSLVKTTLLFSFEEEIDSSLGKKTLFFSFEEKIDSSLAKTMLLSLFENTVDSRLSKWHELMLSCDPNICPGDLLSGFPDEDCLDLHKFLHALIPLSDALANLF